MKKDQKEILKLKPKDKRIRRMSNFCGKISSSLSHNWSPRKNWKRERRKRMGQK